MFPKHAREGLIAADRMGAKILECDVAFTGDRQLVCRHSRCDLHTTTDILARPQLAAKCTRGFEPTDPATGRKASARCCTSDLTLGEFKSRTGEMDAATRTPPRLRPSGRRCPPIAPSTYARAAKRAGLGLIAWSLARSGRLRTAAVSPISRSSRW